MPKELSLHGVGEQLFRASMAVWHELANCDGEYPVAADARDARSICLTALDLACDSWQASHAKDNRAKLDAIQEMIRAVTMVHDKLLEPQRDPWMVFL